MEQTKDVLRQIIFSFFPKDAPNPASWSEPLRSRHTSLLYSPPLQSMGLHGKTHEPVVGLVIGLNVAFNMRYRN